MPENIKEIYLEARAVFEKSPRSAAALLRLALQILLKVIGGKGDNPNNDIGTLLKTGQISPDIQKACDVLRVVGNNAVHPGQIDVNDNQELAAGLFYLLNYIVREKIESQAEVSELFSKLPKAVIENIAKRDDKK
jgi:hypothetical protein